MTLMIRVRMRLVPQTVKMHFCVLEKITADVVSYDQYGILTINFYIQNPVMIRFKVDRLLICNTLFDYIVFSFQAYFSTLTKILNCCWNSDEYKNIDALYGVNGLSVCWWLNFHRYIFTCAGCNAIVLPGTEAQIQNAIALFLCGVALSQLIYGPLSDSFGRKKH